MNIPGTMSKVDWSSAAPGAALEEVEVEEIEGNGKNLKTLKPWHKQMCSMIAQGIPRATIANVFKKTPEYISMLAAQPLIQTYIQQDCTYAGLQLEAQFVQSVTAISDTLENGNHKEKMQAARLQLEATKRIGPRSTPQATEVNFDDRLMQLSERLVGLLESQKMATQPTIIEGEYNES